MNRDHCTPAQLAAHQILDKARAGAPLSHLTIRRALYVLGETKGNA